MVDFGQPPRDLPRPPNLKVYRTAGMESGLDSEGPK